MAMFVHLAPDSVIARIRRNGISRLRKAVERRPGGIYCVPVTRNFYISHQWLRELKRRGQGPISAVYFRVPDEERVWVGHYGANHREVTAAEAVGVFLSAEDVQGWQVIIPRRIEPAEIHRTRIVPQVVGWRFSPAAKGRVPCPCDFCSRGEYGAASIRRRLGEGT